MHGGAARMRGRSGSMSEHTKSRQRRSNIERLHADGASDRSRDTPQRRYMSLAGLWAISTVENWGVMGARSMLDSVRRDWLDS